MAGHSHWKQIKHKKGAEDKKRGRVFSKLLKAVSLAAKTDKNIQFNPNLRATVEKAKSANIPQEKIDKAIMGGEKNWKNLEEVIFEAYGPGGSAIIIEAITDNVKRTANEVRLVLKSFGAKWAESGSVRWTFKENNRSESTRWEPKFPQKISSEEKSNLVSLCSALEEIDGVQEIYTNSI